jgi:hypothetical protein
MKTIVPLAGSPLINAGDSSSCPAIDQRSANRVGRCDLDAAEYGAAAYKIYLPLISRP